MCCKYCNQDSEDVSGMEIHTWKYKSESLCSDIVFVYLKHLFVVLHLLLLKITAAFSFKLSFGLC